MQPSKVIATETAPGSGVFNIAGPCTGSLPGPMSSLTRCIRQISVAGFTTGNSGTVTFTGRGAPMTDGGPPPVNGSLRMTSGHAFTVPASQDFPVTFQ